MIALSPTAKFPYTLLGIEMRCSFSLCFHGSTIMSYVFMSPLLIFLSKTLTMCFSGTEVSDNWLWIATNGTPNIRAHCSRTIARRMKPVLPFINQRENTHMSSDTTNDGSSKSASCTTWVSIRALIRRATVGMKTESICCVPICWFTVLTVFW